MNKGKKVIYFNHWFSSMECLMLDLKNKYKDDITLVASSSNDNVTYKNVVDIFVKTDETFDEWIDLCNRYKVDVFFCRDKFNIVSHKQLKEFRSAGVEVILDKNELADDKVEFYRLMDDICRFNIFPDIVIPYYATFDGCETKKDVMQMLNRIFAYLNTNGLTPTFKLRDGEGGISYRIVRVDDKSNYDSLSYSNGRVLGYDDTIRLFNNLTGDEAKTIMFMEKLDAPEISIDCYDSKHYGFIAYGREKIGRQQLIFDCQNTDNREHIEMREFAYKIAKSFNLKNPFNVQFMRCARTGSLAILEVNTRLSGGSYMLTPLGINLCDIVINDRLFDTEKRCNLNLGFNNGKSQALVARTEKPVLV